MCLLRSSLAIAVASLLSSCWGCTAYHLVRWGCTAYHLVCWGCTAYHLVCWGCTTYHLFASLWVVKYQPSSAEARHFDNRLAWRLMLPFNWCTNVGSLLPTLEPKLHLLTHQLVTLLCFMSHGCHGMGQDHYWHNLLPSFCSPLEQGGSMEPPSPVIPSWQWRPIPSLLHGLAYVPKHVFMLWTASFA